MESFKYNDISLAPEGSGVYAWYYLPHFPRGDIKFLIDELNGVLARSDREKKIRDFLETHLFRPLVAQPFFATIGGKLKPNYSGSLVNDVLVSESIVTRLADNPQSLVTVDKILRDTVPKFASPIYIGMAKSLKGRLLIHRKLIARYTNGSHSSVRDDVNDGDTDLDHSFARDVAETRKLSTEFLRVFTLRIDYQQGEESLVVDIENLLNRINYPLCGRN